MRCAPRCRCSNTARTSARTRGPDASTCRPTSCARPAIDDGQLLDADDDRPAAQRRERAGRAVGRAARARPARWCAGCRGWARLAVAGYVGGGLATADALRAADFDVLAALVKPSQGTDRRAQPPPAGRALSCAVATRPARAGRLPRVRADHRGAGPQLRVGHPAADHPEAARAVGRLRLRPARRRHRRRRPAGRREAAPARARPAAAAAAPGDYPDDPVLVALADAAHRLPIPLDAFGELVDGCEMDVRGEVYDSLDDLACTAAAWPARSGGCRSASSTPAAGRTRGTRRRAGRHARHRAAADQHPARHPRGSRQRPGLPAAQGPRAVRGHPDDDCRTAASIRATARWPS